MSGSNVVATATTFLDRRGRPDPGQFGVNGTGLGMTLNMHRAGVEVRAALERLAAAEQELAETRAALLAAEVALTAAGTAPVPDAYTVEQVAHALGISRSKVWEMLKRREIASHLIGSSRRVFRSDLDAYIASVRNAA